MRLRSIPIIFFIFWCATITYGQPFNEQEFQFKGTYQLDGLSAKVDEEATPISAMITSEDGRSFSLTVAWQGGKYNSRDHLMKFSGDLISEEHGLLKIRLFGMYDQDGLRQSKAKPPLSAVGILTIDLNQTKASGKSKTCLLDGKVEEMAWEFLSIQSNK